MEKWVPFVHMEEQKLNWLALHEQHLQYIRQEGDAFLKRIIARDETWCHNELKIVSFSRVERANLSVGKRPNTKK